MSDVFFEIDNYALLIAIIFILLLVFFYRWGKSFSEPALFFSNLHGFGLKPKGWRVAFNQIPSLLIWGALISFLVAFTDPHLLITKNKEEKGKALSNTHFPTQGIAIYLVLDQSGSMKEDVLTRSPKGKRIKISKIELLKEVTKDFVEGNSDLNLKGRPNDLIGLIFFARTSHIESPLTLVHKSILKKLDGFDVVKDKDQDGTAIGYAIFKTVNVIAATRHFAQELVKTGKPAYEIKNSIIILVTDGLQDPNPLDKGRRLRNMDLEEAAEYAKANNVRVYIVNVEPKIASEEFAPHRRLMQRMTELTGGKFYLVEGATNLGEIYAEIDRIEKSVLPQLEGESEIPKDKRPDLYRRISFYPYFIGLGMLFLFAAIVFEGTILRRVP